MQSTVSPQQVTSPSVNPFGTTTEVTETRPQQAVISYICGSMFLKKQLNI